MNQAFNIIILNNQKKLNLKLSTNGNFQITGCKNLQMVQSSLQYLLHLLHDSCPEAIKGWKNNLNVSIYKTTILSLNSKYTISISITILVFIKQQ